MSEETNHLEVARNMLKSADQDPPELGQVEATIAIGHLLVALVERLDLIMGDDDKYAIQTWEKNT